MMPRSAASCVRTAAAIGFALLLAFLGSFLQPQAARSATALPLGFADSLVTGGLSSPTAMAFAPDGRVFVAEQGGALRVVEDGQLLSLPFLTVPVSSSGERGLLGVAFDPNFATNQYVYVYYTATTPSVHNRVSRFTANGNVALAGSETVILDLTSLSSSTNHNGGALHFGADGKLYIATGENGDGANAQSLSNLLGKVLRINPDGSIPADNPFYNTASGVNRAIWALGLRNPFTFDVQPGTGRIFINDVGEASWEEINDGIAGSNYGWPATEGYTSNPAYRSPLYAYAHGGGSTTGCAITGGAFYNPALNQFPAEYTGDYFFADLCSGWIRAFDPVADSVADFAAGVASPVDLKVGPDGNLYYLGREPDELHKISYTGLAPTVGTHPTSQIVSVGYPVTFSVSASGSPPLSYQWQRNGANIPGATSDSYTIASATLADNGATFRVVVSNAYGSATSNAATLTVTTNQPPNATISAPVNGSLYAAGDTINYAGSGNDPEDGALPAGAFAWKVDFHHGSTHVHPFIPWTAGATSGSFAVPTLGETSTNVWYRIHLRVTDSIGLTREVYRDVLPRTTTINLLASPSGLQVTLDGQPRTAPASVPSVVGMRRVLGVVSPQSAGGTGYVFDHWSDGGAASHEITTPSTAVSYTATYLEAVTFDDRAGQNQVLNGEYPAGVIDWGTNGWYHSGPWKAFTTKSVGFNGPGLTTGTFTFISSRQLLRVDAYNGGAPTTVTLSCPGQPDRVTAVGSGQLVRITTGWSAACSTVMVSSTNGWDTNFDDFVLGGSGPAAPDSDGDGCTDAAEQQTAAGSELTGGRRDPNNFWDFFDTPDGGNVRDRVVSTADIARVVTHFGTSGTATSVSAALAPPVAGYHAAFDRSPPAPGGDPWDLRAADGSITTGDLLAVVVQMGHSCAG